MKLELNLSKEDRKEILNTLEVSFSKKSHLGILKDVCFDVNRETNILRIITVSEESSSEYILKTFKAERSFQMVFSFEKLKEIFKQENENNLYNFEVKPSPISESFFDIFLEYGTTKEIIEGKDPDYFPINATKTENQISRRFSVNPFLLGKKINAVEFATAWKHEQRQQLQGINFQHDGGNYSVKMASTDSRRLNVQTLPVINDTRNFEKETVFTLPGDICKKLAKVFDKKEHDRYYEEVKFFVEYVKTEEGWKKFIENGGNNKIEYRDFSRIIIEFNNKKFIIRKIDGKFPNYKAILSDKMPDYLFEIEIKDVLNYLTGLKVLKGKEEDCPNMIRITTEEEYPYKMTIHHENSQKTFPVRIDRWDNADEKTFEFGMNKEYLKDVLKYLKGEKIHTVFLGMTSSILPLMFCEKRIYKFNEEENFFIIMPVRVKKPETV